MKDYRIYLKDILARLEEESARGKPDRLARECARLDPAAERAMAEEVMGEELEQWAEY